MEMEDRLRTNDGSRVMAHCPIFFVAIFDSGTNHGGLDPANRLWLAVPGPHAPITHSHFAVQCPAIARCGGRETCRHASDDVTPRCMDAADPPRAASGLPQEAGTHMSSCYCPDKTMRSARPWGSLVIMIDLPSANSCCLMLVALLTVHQCWNWDGSFHLPRQQFSKDSKQGHAIANKKLCGQNGHLYHVINVHLFILPFLHISITNRGEHWCNMD